jgi:hypothetical protein
VEHVVVVDTSAGCLELLGGWAFWPFRRADIAERIWLIHSFISLAVSADRYRRPCAHDGCNNNNKVKYI